MKEHADAMFDPYEQSVSSTVSGGPAVQRLKEEGAVGGMPDYPKMIESLVAERRVMMAHPPASRNMQIYVPNQKKLNQFD